MSHLMPRMFDPLDDSFFPRGSKPQSGTAEKPKPLLEAHKVDRLGPLKSGSNVTYCIIDAPVNPGKVKDRRIPPRKRTRLRSGKILDQRGKFLIECQVHDRSAVGAHLRPMSTLTLPQHIKFYDDEQRILVDAEIIWREKGELGIRFMSRLNAEAIKSGKRSALASKYYAVK